VLAEDSEPGSGPDLSVIVRLVAELQADLDTMREGIDEIREGTAPIVYLFEGLNMMQAELRASLNGVRGALMEELRAAILQEAESSRQSFAEIRDLLLDQGNQTREILTWQQKMKHAPLSPLLLNSGELQEQKDSSESRSPLLSPSWREVPTGTFLSSSVEASCWAVKTSEKGEEKVASSCTASLVSDAVPKEKPRERSASQHSVDFRDHVSIEHIPSNDSDEYPPMTNVPSAISVASTGSSLKKKDTARKGGTVDFGTSETIEHHANESDDDDDGAEEKQSFKVNDDGKLVKPRKSRASERTLQICTTTSDDKVEGWDGLRANLEDVMVKTSSAPEEWNKSITRKVTDGAESRAQSQYSNTKSLALVRISSRRLSAFVNKSLTDDDHHNPFACEIVVRMVEHPFFEAGAAAVIITHSLFIGAYVHYMATVSMKGHIVFTVGNAFLTFCFFMEVLLKAIAEGKLYIWGPERRWNWFDMALLLLVVGEVCMRYAGLGGSQKKTTKTILKMAELIRTTRILRIFRFLKFSESLTVIIGKIFASVTSLTWILLMMGMMMFVVAVTVTTGSLYILHGDGYDEPDPVMTDELRKVDMYFGSVTNSMFSIFASMSGGYLWADLVDIMTEMGFLYQVIFVLFMALITFAFLNLITGIFVDNATQADQEISQQRETKKRMEQYELLRKLFQDIDTCRTGMVTCQEFVEYAAASTPKSGRHTKASVASGHSHQREKMAAHMQSLGRDCNS
jgi:hypothetical protein